MSPATRPPRTPGAERKRRERERRKAGLTRYELWLPIEILEALIAPYDGEPRMSESQALRHHLVERELAKILIEWAQRWLTRHT